jgi:3-phenylpropionate/trans-cinnamate dioxygenase ferredoxin reductase subunit
MSDETFVIVGASLAGAKAAETLRAEGFTGRVVLIGEETEPPYERPPLSKGYLMGSEPREKAYLHEPQWYLENGIEWRAGSVVLALDVTAKTVELHPTETIGYDKLLLATGSRVRRLTAPGADLAGVRYLRTLDQADELLTGFQQHQQVVVVGAGWIGLETAAAARQHGCTVTVVEQDTLPLRRVLGDEVAGVYRDLHAARGVDFRFGAGVTQILGTDGAVSGVLLDDGWEVAADVVVVGIGIEPAVELAMAAGLDVDNGVVTDEYLRTSDPDVYACGDVASSFNPLLGRRLRVEHWANALNGGPAAARSMLGNPAPYAPIPYFFSDQYDLGMEYTGWVDPDSDVNLVFRGDPTVVAGPDAAAPEFLAFWVRGGAVLAGMNANVWDVTETVGDLVKAGLAGRTVDLAALADPEIPLTDLLG